MLRLPPVRFTAGFTWAGLKLKPFFHSRLLTGSTTRRWYHRTRITRPDWYLTPHDVSRKIFSSVMAMQMTRKPWVRRSDCSSQFLSQGPFLTSIFSPVVGWWCAIVISEVDPTCDQLQICITLQPYFPGIKNFGFPEAIPILHCFSKMHQLWNGIAQNYNDQFW